MRRKPWKITIEKADQLKPYKTTNQGETLEKTLEMALAYVEKDTGESIQLVNKYGQPI